MSNPPLQKAVPVPYIPVQGPVTRYVMAQQPQDIYVAPETFHSWSRPPPPLPPPPPPPPQPYQTPWQPPFGQPYYMFIANGAYDHRRVMWANQQQQSRSFNHYGNRVNSLQYSNHAPVTPDRRLNPNSREFVATTAKHGQATPQQTGVSTPSSIASPITSSNAAGCEGNENGLDKQMDALSMINANDSGIAESSRENSRSNSIDKGAMSSTPKVKGDGVVATLCAAKAQMRECAKDAGKTKETEAPTSQDPSDEIEKIWNSEDDEKYWKIQGRSAPSVHSCSVIVKQIEYYMSDEYLAKDKYLLRQIRCKKDGYVSIKLMTSFKKMKKLTKDWPVLRSAIARVSQNLIASGEGLRIRRKDMLPEELRKSRELTTVLAIRLPHDYNSVKRIMSLFQIFGEISFVRLLKPDKPVPVDLRNYATQIPDIGLSLCAVVEFDSCTDAVTAVRVLKHKTREPTEIEDQKNDEKDNTEEETELSEEDQNCLNKISDELPSLAEMRLALLGPRVRRTLYRQDRKKQTKEERTEAVNPNHQGPNFRRWRRWKPDLKNIIRQPKGVQDNEDFKLKRTVSTLHEPAKETTTEAD